MTLDIGRHNPKLSDTSNTKGENTSHSSIIPGGTGEIDSDTSETHEIRHGVSGGCPGIPDSPSVTGSGFWLGGPGQQGIINDLCWRPFTAPGGPIVDGDAGQQGGIDYQPWRPCTAPSGAIIYSDAGQQRIINDLGGQCLAPGPWAAPDGRGVSGDRGNERVIKDPLRRLRLAYYLNPPIRYPDAPGVYHAMSPVPIQHPYAFSIDYNAPQLQVPTHPATKPGVPRGRTFYSEDMPPMKEEEVSDKRWVGFVTLVCHRGGLYRPRSSGPVAYGGFSDIWQCDTLFFDGSKVVVAVKKLRAIKLTPGLDKSQTTKSMLRRLTTELQVWMHLNHPNIAPLLGFNFADEIAIISPWFGNGNIADYLTVHPEADKVELIQGVTAGVCYLHSPTPVIVHGDLKPDNVLIDQWGRPKLIDFGLSKIVEEEPGLSSVLPVSLREAGNARWIAPELLWEENASRSVQTDIFSFGCVAFFILTGDVPFKNTPDGQLVIARYKGAYPTPEIAVYQELSTKTELIAVLHSCWSTDPGERPSMDDIVRFLKHGGENGLHLPPSPNGAAAPFIPWLPPTSAPEITLQLCSMEQRTNTPPPARRRSRSIIRRQLNSFKAFFRKIFKSEGGNS